MQKILFSFLLGTLFLFACGQQKNLQLVDGTVEKEPLTEEISTNSTEALIPFFYQYVGNFKDGTGENSVRVGKSEDGVKVSSYDVVALDWKLSMSNTLGYGDPVFSYLSNGKWAVTARSSRGASDLKYGESSCPVIDDNEVVSLGVSTASGCKKVSAINGGKTSQIFDVEGQNYVFHMIMGEIFLANVSDVKNLNAMCVLESSVKKLADLKNGESTKVISSSNSGGLTLSDTAIAKRTDGTWVLFVKGIPKGSIGSSCPGASICELCARSIYRTTSSDLINWSSFEKVVGESSIPEAITMLDGTVRLYWQDFTDVCKAEDMSLALTAPISTSYEMPGTFKLSEPESVSFPDEEFETNSKIHYATNGNPISSAGMVALDACME